MKPKCLPETIIWTELSEEQRKALLRWTATEFRANLRRANLSDADLRHAKRDYLTIGLHDAPAGKLIGWKKVFVGDDGGKAVIKLEIPESSRRSCATTRKFRAEFVIVLDAPDGAHSKTLGITNYVTGQTVYPDSWDENRWEECSHGIHFFLTREEAEAWEL
jgi:hypothetical protein